MSAPYGLIDEKLKEWATPRQAEFIDAVNAAGGKVRVAAKKMGVHPSTFNHGLRRLRESAALRGFSPEHDMTHPVPSPFVVRGTSTLYDEDGKARMQWVKTRLDDKKQEEAIKAFIESLVSDARGLSPKVEKPKRTLQDLMVVYPVGDPHFGMYAWAAEAGEDFDLSIAERITTAAVDRLVASVPETEVGLLDLLGDFFHADDQSNQTPAHKHQLDVDSRYPKVLMVGMRTIRHVILRLLEKHKTVVVRIEPGNHDPHAMWALAFTLHAYFENNKRVTVDLTPSKFWYYRFGKVLIGSTHGDTVKHDRLPGLMAAERAEDWGQTKHRYWYTGHIHTQTVNEYPGVICESFRTLAAKDAYAAAYGYRSGRDMYAIVHHKEFGEIERHRCDVRMLEAA